MKYFYFSSSVSDAQRYMPKWLQGNKTEIVLFRSPVSIIQVLRSAKKNDIIVTNSLRWIDIALMLLFQKRGLSIINFQHGENEYLANRGLKVLYKKLINKGYISEFLSICVCLFIYFFMRSAADAKNSLICVYFTSQYRSNFEKKVKNRVKLSVRLIQVGFPSPLTWGTPVIIEQAGFCDMFIVDEPFEGTYGIRESTLASWFENLVNEVNPEEIWVKLHPRRTVNIYKDLKCSKKIRFVENIPQSCQVLVGANSNLLRVSFDHDCFLRLTRDGFRKEVLRDTLFTNRVDINDIDLTEHLRKSE